jgi:hypothetical protein
MPSTGRIFFDFEIRIILRLQQWGKMKFIQHKLKTSPKLLKFILQ